KAEANEGPAIRRREAEAGIRDRTSKSRDRQQTGHVTGPAIRDTCDPGTSDRFEQSDLAGKAFRHSLSAKGRKFVSLDRRTGQYLFRSQRRTRRRRSNAFRRIRPTAPAGEPR